MKKPKLESMDVTPSAIGVEIEIEKETPPPAETMKTTEEPNARWERIQEIAKKYDNDLDVSEKIKLLRFIQQDIEADRDRLAKQMESIDKLLGTHQRTTPKPTMTGAGPVKRRTKSEKKTTAELIMEVLNDGKSHHKDEILKLTSELKGKKISEPSLNASLSKLKKEKLIKSPERGQYQKS